MKAAILALYIADNGRALDALVREVARAATEHRESELRAARAEADRQKAALVWIAQEWSDNLSEVRSVAVAALSVSVPEGR